MTIRPVHRKTFPSSRIPETLLMLIRLRGGSNAEVNPAFVYAPLADFYELSEDLRRLSAADYYSGENASGIAWNSEVDFAVRCLRKDGYLTVAARSGKSSWRLTPNGVERADFWLERMTDKYAALSLLKVDPNIASSDTGEDSVLRRASKADST
jgi:hypothetical protein